MNERLYNIPEGNFETFKREIARLNKRAQKLGCNEISFTELRVWDKEITKDLEGNSIPPYLIRFHEIEVKGEAPKFNGWRFLATIQHTEEGNILSTIPEAPEVAAKYRECNPWCDHCQIMRQRNDTFIVEHEETKEQKQVGSTCIKDFLGHNSPEKVASMAELYFGFMNLCGEAESLEWGRGSSGPYRFSLEHFLPYVVHSINERGYVSRKEEKESVDGRASTATIAFNTFRPGRGVEHYSPLQEEIDFAQAARDYVLTSLEGKERNDFEHNLFTIAKLSGIEIRNTGIASYIVQYYRKHLEQEETNKARKLGNFVGTVGERLRGLQLKAVKISSFENMYGVQWVNKLVDDSGNWFTWITSTQSFEIGEGVILDGTVKKHEEYKGLKSTLLTRCKVVS